jgi:homoserine O-acetyltransferase/O-succinyltransferase
MRKRTIALTWARGRTLLATAGLAVCLATPALAQQEGVFVIPHFAFEGGGSLDDMKVSYLTWGKRAPGDGNVIVLVPATSGTKTWANAHIGAGKTFDTDKYFVVSIDAIGGGGSSQPRDGLGAQFPQYNIRDMVRAQHALLNDGLGLRHALAIGGGSSGAYQALEWGVVYPGFAQGLILYAGAAHADRQVKLIVDGIVATLSLDPAFAAGKAVPPGGDAVRKASTVYFPWLLTDRALEGMGSDEVLAKAEAGFADSWARNWDAIGLAWRYRSSRLHDVAAPYGGNMATALGRVTDSVLVLAVTTDRTHPISLNESMARGLVNAKLTYAPLDSIRGHTAVFVGPGTPEYEFVSSTTRAFLATLK